MNPPRTAPPPPHVAIVGGGLAGLATAVSLVNSGVRITLFESRPRLGGRASSFQDPATGEMVDNCQHVSMACCTNLADFCRKVGTADLFRHVPEILFLSPEGKLSRLCRRSTARASPPFRQLPEGQLPELVRTDPSWLRRGLPGDEPERSAGRAFRIVAPTPRTDGSDDRAILVDRPGLGAQRAP